MTERTSVHDTFVIERTYPTSPARVFAAWSSREAKGRWFVGPDEWEKSDHTMDFRVGGKESVSGGPPGGVVHRYDATYQDIVENQRIVSTYEMYMDDVRTSVSVATLELKPDSVGTRLILTEQGVFLDGHDIPGERERGTKGLLDNLEKALTR